MFQNEIRLKWFVDEVFDDDNNPENFPQERYYDINLYQPADMFQAKETSTIKYIHSEEISSDRALSNFEIGLLAKAITSVRIPFKSDAFESSNTHPYDNYRVVIKTYYFDLEFRWSDNDAIADPKAYKSLMKLVKLISKIEPIDYEGLAVEPPGIKE